MHELSLAYSLVEAASEAALKAGVERVRAVNVQIGKLAGVVTDALLFCFDIAADGTPLAGAKLVVEELPIIVHCPKCEKDMELSGIQWFCCPDCQTPTPHIIQGKELELVSLELFDD